MGINVSNDVQRNSRLNQRISADLRTRAQTAEKELPDFEEDSEYLKETKKTGKFTWVWIVLIVLAILSLICIIFI